MSKNTSKYLANAIKRKKKEEKKKKEAGLSEIGSDLGGYLSDAASSAGNYLADSAKDLGFHAKQLGTKAIVQAGTAAEDLVGADALSTGIQGAALGAAGNALLGQMRHRNATKDRLRTALRDAILGGVVGGAAGGGLGYANANSSSGHAGVDAVQWLQRFGRTVTAAELTGDQKKLDVDKDGKIESSDLAKLREKKEAIWGTATGGILGAGIGAAKADKGKRLDGAGVGAIRGAGAGFGTELGAIGGGLLGLGAGAGTALLGERLTGRLPKEVLAALLFSGGGIGALAGGGLGSAVGYQSGKRLSGLSDKEKREEEASKESALKGDQKKIDINKNDKIDGADLAMLRNQKKVVKGEIVSKEAILYLARNKEAFSKDQLQALLAQGKGLANQAVGKAKSLAPTLAIGQALQNPNVQNALGGAALGAGAGGLSYLLSRDKDKSLGNRLLTGAALGGITGGAYNRAKNYFRGPQLAEDRADFVGPRQPAEYRDDFVGPPRPGPFDAGPGNVQPGDADNNPFKQSAEKLARLFGRRRSSSRSSSRGRGGYGVSTGASSRSIRSSSRGGYGSSRGRTSYRRPAPVAKAAPAKPAPKPAPKAAPKPVSDKGNVSMGRSNTKADKAQAGQMAERSGIARQKAKDDAARETRKRKASQPASKGNLSMGRSNTQADQQYAKQMAAKSKPKAAPSRANLTVGGKSTDSLKQKKAAPKSKGPIIDAYWGR